jgi:hypothetical protein
VGGGLGAVAFSIAAARSLKRAGRGAFLSSAFDFSIFSTMSSSLRRGRRRVLLKKLEDAWQERCRLTPISPVLQFTPEGLVLGAGTVIVAIEGRR